MCGIAAIYAYASNAPPVDSRELARICDHMRTRGPDGQGQWLSADRRLGLAHRRLAVIDLTAAAAQPMQTPDGKLRITFNGEIYNYQALREDLQRKGHTFRTHSDTEVLLQLYQEKGEAMVRELRGMFAFALWDGRKQAMLLARDPFGIKPLYYCADGETVRVASQVKALLAGGQISAGRDPAGIVGFYLLGSVPEPFTTYAAIRALPAGSTLWLTAQGPQPAKEYFSVAHTWTDAERHPASGDVPQAVRSALLDSVSHHLVADVPVAVFLSAGVDSGAILGLVRELAPDAEIQAITLVFEEFAASHDDEAPLAAAVAELYGAKHTLRMVTREEFEADLPGIVQAMDQPSIDGINSWFVSKAAQELGIKVALSGLGGDELFGGYPAFSDVPRWERYLRLPGKLPLLGKLATALGALVLKNTKLAKAAGLLQYGGTYAGAWLLRRGLYMPWELEQVLPRELVAEGLERLRPLAAVGAAAGEARNPHSRVAAMESVLYMRNQLLRDADWAGMAHSLEIRTPLVDSALLERLAPYLAAQEKMNGKLWLGQSPRQPLPGSVVFRQKTGFATPIRLWIMRGTVDSALTAQQHWSRRWARGIASDFGLPETA
jgi:asparagine synthase (glutamine-hydrolysing)